MPRPSPRLTDTPCVVSRLTVFRDNDANAPPRTPGLSAETLRIMIQQMAVPNERCLIVPLGADRDQDRLVRCCIAVSDAAGWDVRLEINDRVVALTHCGDWHHVERLCATLRSIWAAPHTEPSARR